MLQIPTAVFYEYILLALDDRSILQMDTVCRCMHTTVSCIGYLITDDKTCPERFSIPYKKCNANIVNRILSEDICGNYGSRFKVQLVVIKLLNRLNKQPEHYRKKFCKNTTSTITWDHISKLKLITLAKFGYISIINNLLSHEEILCKNKNFIDALLTLINNGFPDIVLPFLTDTRLSSDKLTKVLITQVAT